MKALKAGFTLIELMIVVAIIGLLAALAIPNFLKFQARSRQSEARANLKSSYTAEKSYYGDKQMYLDLFDVCGFSPEWNNRYTYFLSGSGGAGVDPRTTPGAVPVSGVSATCAPLTGVSIIRTDFQKYPGTAAYVEAGIGNRQQNPGSTVPGMALSGVGQGAPCCPQGVCEFVVAAVGNIDNDTTLDQWDIGSQGSTAVGDAIACGAGTWSTGTFAEGEPANECNDVSL
jgi:type IV pilus assembly protein PilA